MRELRQFSCEATLMYVMEATVGKTQFSPSEDGYPYVLAYPEVLKILWYKCLLCFENVLRYAFA